MVGLRLTTFEEVDLKDPFFDSLKSQYDEFPSWFEKKARAKEPVYIIDDAVPGSIRGFVYLKVESGIIDDVDPPLPAAKRLKVGTMKINARGTKLGERVIKKIFDHAIREKVSEIYVTVFDTHEALIRLFKKYGFIVRGSKTTPNGQERVLVRSLEETTGDIIKDYPLIHTAGRSFFLLAIYPEYHSHLFPDSILKTEHPDILSDVSHTNTIHKVYVGGVALTRMKRGDIVLIYRTTDIPGRAYFRSVVTSVCVVEEAKSKKDFANAAEFVKFAEKNSVFTRDELEEKFTRDGRLYAVQMTYNVAFGKRTIRGTLLDRVGIPEHPQWQFLKLTRAQFDQIVDLGQIDEGIIVD